MFVENRMTIEESLKNDKIKNILEKTSNGKIFTSYKVLSCFFGLCIDINI